MLGRKYFTGKDDYQNFWAFASMLNLLTLDNNKKVTNWISTGVSPEKNKPFDTNLTSTVTNLGNGKVSLIFKKKTFFKNSLHSNFF